ncbi:MAG: sigma 54-interacting transcriptional regulator [bacterium]
MALKNQKTTLQNKEPSFLGSAAFVTKYRQLADSMQFSRQPLLITGESGVGKTQLARYLCYHSAENGKPCKTIWLNEIPEELLESELFGHCDDHGNKYEGRIKLNDKGTIILKGITRLPGHLQAKLLRLIETGNFERIGDDNLVQVNVRLICTTNKNLRQLTTENTFRSDLYCLLSANQIIVQPLRNRPEDIRTLSQYFISETAKRQKKNLNGIASNAMRVLQSYAWPGNVRELKAEIENAVSKSDPQQKTLRIEFLSPKVRFNFSQLGVPDTIQLFDKVKSIERQLIIEAIEENGGNKSVAARALGVKHRTLYQKMKSLGIPLNFNNSEKIEA